MQRIELHRRKIGKGCGARVSVRLDNIAYISESKGYACVQLYIKDIFGTPIFFYCIESYDEVLALINKASA